MRLFLLVLLPMLVGCPPPDDPPDPPIFVPPRQEIGTWPTPEMNALGEEKCDDLDNDGDGSIDEGCSCTADRSCVVVNAGQCVEGTQSCTNGLGDCVASGSVLGAAETAAVAILGVTPAVLTPLDAMGPQVTVDVQPSCAQIHPPYVVVVLEAETPAMRVWALGRDDGVAPDASADDDVYSLELINPFGPGVPTQTMTIEVGVRLDEEWVLAEDTLDWQAD